MAVPNLWRTKEQRYRLQGEVCPACSTAMFPPKRVCPHCNHGAARPSTTEAQQEYAYVMLFEMPQISEFAAIGDD